MSVIQSNPTDQSLSIQMQLLLLLLEHELESEFDIDCIPGDEVIKLIFRQLLL